MSIRRREDVWARYVRTQDVRLRNEIAEAHLRVVLYLAGKMKERMPHNVTEEELVSAGYTGLLEAVERFNPARGCAFKTYCPGRIRGAMLDYLRGLDVVSRLTRSRANRLEAARDDLERRNARPPTHGELAAALGLSPGRLDALKRQTVHAMARRDDALPLDMVEDRRAPGPASVDSPLDMASTVCRRLRRKERYIVVMYYAEGMTMAEIGLVLGLSESRVCQVHARALARLRMLMRRGRRVA